MAVEIHPTAIVHSRARIGADSVVGPYSVIGEFVQLGDRCRVASHVVIEGHTEIGDDNSIFQFASVGSIPQDLKYRGEESRLVIGNRNIIREYSTLQPGTTGGGMLTKIGDSNLFMANSHVGHDSRMGSSNVVANSVAIAGHVEVGNFATLGGLSAVHQFVRIGDYGFLGGGAMVAQDVPPYCIVEGNRASIAGFNEVALERRKFSREEIARLKEVYRVVFRGEGTLRSRIDQCRRDPALPSSAHLLLDFILASSRGICAVRRKGQNGE